MTVAEQWEQLWLPLFPLASDDLPAGVDREDALMRALWNRHDWLPNAVVENPANGHAHTAWALREPITHTEYAGRKPLGAAVVEGLRRSVDGDAWYSGLIAKNPAHAAWEPQWITDERRSPGQRQEHLDDSGFMPSASWKRSKQRNTVELGRNCSIFESARIWTYRPLQHYFGAPQMYADAVLAHVLELNSEFPEPLQYSEANAIATSISRWVITESRMWADSTVVCEANFIAMQSARGRKGGKKSGPLVAQTRANQRNQTILEELL
jgi:hypothetical protein